METIETLTNELLETPYYKYELRADKIIRLVKKLFDFQLTDYNKEMIKRIIERETFYIRNRNYFIKKGFDVFIISKFGEKFWSTC